MSLRARGLLVGIASAVLVLVLTMAAAERQSPGPVSGVHARIAELDGGQACAQCHGGWFGNMHASCTECHEEITAQLEQGHGLHGALADGVGSNCSTCHSEHNGAEFRLVNRLAFAQAGVPDPEKFDHKIVGLDLTGAHVGLDCSKCHEHADAEVLPEGAKRFLGLSRDCASCHANPHGDQMQFACVTCHTQDNFGERIVPSHDRYLALEGAHGLADCRRCHQSGSQHALEALRPRSGLRARACAECHDSPHVQGFVVGNAQSEGMTPDAGCVICHTLEHESFDDPALHLTTAQHEHAGFSLGEPHQAVQCTQCHAADGTFAERHLGRGPDDCRSCHQDPHGGQFDDSPLAQQDCVSCHERTHFAPHAFDVEMHAQTVLPLDGQHAQQKCEACHVMAGESSPAGALAADVRRFRGTPSRCENCHDDAHQAAFGDHRKKLDAHPRGQCATCHGTEAWADLDHDHFDHQDWTGFGLDGAHGQIDCTDCHARSDEPDAVGRRFGRIPAHVAGQADCVRCHGDPHEGIFDKQGTAASIEGRTGCVRCHDTASFRALPHGFDHAAFTGFELTGKHGQLDCSSCHEQLPHATNTGRTWGKVKGRDCASCHTDPHLGQFVRVGKTDCYRCHKSANTFATVSFRHNLDSRFQLGDQHRKVACGLCHKTETQGGATFVRYKPLPTKCVDCHGREEGGRGNGRRRRR